jgi:ribosome-binding protein aMBF1 (putative translation factor)
MPFSSPVVKQSPAFASQLKRALKNKQDEKYYLCELAKLAKNQLAENVSQRRKERKWSQSKLAERVGTTQAVISRIEQGRVDVGLGLLIRLKFVLEIPQIV